VEGAMTQTRTYNSLTAPMRVHSKSSTLKRESSTKNGSLRCCVHF
jgi:hypothetical protein